MFDRLPITKLTLGPGRNPGGPQQEVDLDGLTVFVGPNNSGKSLALAELYRYGIPQQQESWKVVVGLELTPLTVDEAHETLKNFALTDFSIPPNFVNFRSRVGSSVIEASVLLEALQEPQGKRIAFRSYFLGNTTINLNGETRLTLCNARMSGDLLNPDLFNAFQVLFTDDELRRQVRGILERAFTRFFVLIPSTLGQLQIAFADQPPESSAEEQGLDWKSRAYHAKAIPIEQFSDGVKAYTGIIVEILAGNPRVILIDEPEAFLHPPLAQQLGVEISAIVSASRKNVFASTHSAHFVMGCIQSGANVNVIRLTYKDGIATARVLRSNDLRVMMRSALLRSAGVINALFYEYVVVTESDSDRAFYQEINERLLKYAPGRGIPNCLFLNAQNKQTTKIITKPLRELGIPTATIVDVDVLKDGGSVWSSFLESGGFLELDRQSLATSRDQLYAKAKSANLNLKEGGGIELFATSEKEAASNLFDRLEQYGLFVVRKGELESWLKHLNVTGHGPGWLIRMFERLGDEPGDDTFVRPGIDDVWELMDRIRSWLLNPGRKGMPD